MPSPSQTPLPAVTPPPCIATSSLHRKEVAGERWPRLPGSCPYGGSYQPQKPLSTLYLGGIWCSRAPVSRSPFYSITNKLPFQLQVLAPGFHFLRDHHFIQSYFIFAFHHLSTKITSNCPWPFLCQVHLQTLALLLFHMASPVPPASDLLLNTTRLLHILVLP